MLREALALWRGDAYAEFDDEDWARAEAQRLSELRLAAHEVLFDAELACGRSSDVIPELEALASRHPLREAIVAQLMTALYRSGRQADALRTYQEHRAVLIDELGLDPTPVLRELEDRILSHDADLLADPDGQVLRGYRLGERLGTGRDGTIFAAHLPGVDRELVVRVFRREVADAPDFVRGVRDDSAADLVAAAPGDRPDPRLLAGARRRIPRHAAPPGRLARGPPGAPRPPPPQPCRRGGHRAPHRRRARGRCRGGPRARPARSGSGAVRRAGDAWLGDFDLGRSRGPDRRTATAMPSSAGRVVPTVAVERGRRGCRARVRPPASGRRWPSSCRGSLAALTDERPADLAPATNPYKGLRAFDESDAADFFGRDSVVSDVLGATGLRRLAGPARPGRRRLGHRASRAWCEPGLLPRSGAARSRVPSAGSSPPCCQVPRPFKELAAALRRVAVSDRVGIADDLAADGGIDRVDPAARCRRMGSCCSSSTSWRSCSPRRPSGSNVGSWPGSSTRSPRPDSRLRVVGTLRADFYDRPLAVQPFGGRRARMRRSRSQRWLLPSSRRRSSSRRGAVDRQVERPLVAELVSAAVDEPAGLPALQFTLFELAEQCEGDLTLSAYRRLGGLSGAIASRAEALYRSLDDDERDGGPSTCSSSWWSSSSGGEPTRRRALRAEVTDGDASARRRDRPVGAGAPADPRPPPPEPAADRRAGPRGAAARVARASAAGSTRTGSALLVLGQLREAAASWEELDRDPARCTGGRASSRARRTPPSPPHSGARARVPRGRRRAAAAEEREVIERAHAPGQGEPPPATQLVVIGVALVVALVGGFVAVDQREEAVARAAGGLRPGARRRRRCQIDDDPERASCSRSKPSITRTPATTSRPRPSGRCTTPSAVAGRAHRARRRGALDWSPDGRCSSPRDPRRRGSSTSVTRRPGSRCLLARPRRRRQRRGLQRRRDGFATTGDDGRLRIPGHRGRRRAGRPSEGEDGKVGWARRSVPDAELVAAQWIDEGITRVVFDRRSGESCSRS